MLLYKYSINAERGKNQIGEVKLLMVHLSCFGGGGSFICMLRNGIEYEQITMGS